MNQQNLRTGEVAAQAGISIATLRYYERRGLIPPPSRTSSGYRAFGPETVRTLRRIKAAQALGFTLREIQEMLAVVRAPDGSLEQLREMARAKAEELERQARNLRDKHTALRALLATDHDDGDATASQSGFLRALEEAAPALPEPPDE